jgi:hypothetical protein
VHLARIALSGLGRIGHAFIKLALIRSDRDVIAATI